MPISQDEQTKQERYRNARTSKQYAAIWQTVGKCVYCDLNPKYIVHEENGVVMTINLYAYIDGHLLIVPRRHVRSPKDLTELEWSTMRKCMYLAKRLIKQVHGIKGVQIIQKDGADAQSTVTDHVHFQAIPFDAPDLCVWNYRKLKYTPLQNAGLYRRAHSKIDKYAERFEQKYHQLPGLPALCDLVMVNEKREILFQERADFAKIVPDYITIPGGGVTNYSVPLEQELTREVLEEIGHDIDPASIKILASRIYDMRGKDESVYPGGVKRVIWNTYLLEGFESKTKLTPGDDAKALLWVPLNKIQSHPRISPEIKLLIMDRVK